MRTRRGPHRRQFVRRRPPAFDRERPAPERRQRRAADHLDVGRAPGGDVLAEQAVPDVVEREPGERDHAARAQQERTGRHRPSRREPHGAGRAVVAEEEGEDPGEGDPVEPDDDEPVGGVGERPDVTAAVDVPRDVPVVAPHRDEKAHAGDADGDRRPRRQPGAPLGQLHERVEESPAAVGDAQRDHEREGEQPDARGGEDLADRRASRGRRLGSEDRHHDGVPPMRSARTPVAS